MISEAALASCGQTDVLAQLLGSLDTGGRGTKRKLCPGCGFFFFQFFFSLIPSQSTLDEEQATQRLLW